MSLKDSSFNLILITFIIYSLIRFVWLPSKSTEILEISRQHIKYHANWTQSLNQLKELHEFHEALRIKGVKELDVSFAMSSLDFNELQKVFVSPFMEYDTIKINVGNLDIGSIGAQYILNQIPRTVQHLEVYFDSIEANDRLGRILGQRLSTFKRLKSLKVSLILCSMSDEGFDDFFNKHQMSSDLEKLELIFIGNKLNSTSMKSFPSYMQQASKLKEFALNLYANNVMSEGAQYISAGLVNLRNIRSLDLDLYFNNVTQVGTKVITQKIEKFELIQSLNLNLDFNYIKNEGGKYVGAMLKNIRKLNHLSIGVASKNFGYLGFKSLVDGMSHQNQVKTLSLRCGVNRVGINGAGIVTEMLKKTGKNLHKLTIGFVENYIGDEGLQSLTQTIKEDLPKLQDLSIDLAFNDAKGFGGIAALKNIAEKNLKNLDLRLSHNEFRDPDVKLMLPHLKKIIKNFSRNGGEFVFDFVETAISKKMMKEIESMFKQQNLKIFINSVIPEDEPVQSNPEPPKQQVKKETNQKSRGQEENKKKDDVQTKQRQEAERKEKQSAERKQKQEAQRKKQEQAQKKQREQLERKQQEQAQRKQRQQSQRKQRETQRKQREEAQRKQREEAQRKQREEAQRKQREEAQMKRREEAQRKQREEAQKKQQEEAQRKQQQEAQMKRRQEAQMKQRQQTERKSREEAQKKQRQQAQRKQRQEDQKKQREKAERKEQQQAKKEQAERRHKEEDEKKQEQKNQANDNRNKEL